MDTRDMLFTFALNSLQVLRTLCFISNDSRLVYLSLQTVLLFVIRNLIYRKN